MLPIYLDMGYERELFLSDYHKHKCTRKELNSLIDNYRKDNKITSDGADLYVGKLIAIIADPNDSFDYTEEKAALKRIDSNLYEVVIKLCDHWNTVDIESTDITGTSYHDVIFDFSDNLEEWYFDNEVIT
jgi:hypothetical protein